MNCGRTDVRGSSSVVVMVMVVVVGCGATNGTKSVVGCQAARLGVSVQRSERCKRSTKIVHAASGRQHTCM